MERREALKNVALIMGGTVIGMQAFLLGCQSDSKEIEKGKEIFTKGDIALLDEIGETIIPATDTPGAKAVGVGSFMAMMLPDCYPEKEQKAFYKGLETLPKDFEGEFGHAFMEAKPVERKAFLTKLDQEMVQHGGSKKENEPEHYFRIMKELTLLGYFTSEIGCTQARNYVQTPGRYDACIPYSEDGRAWI